MPSNLYRLQAVHVDYWRGTPHRWQNTLHYEVSAGLDVSTLIPDAYAKINAMGCDVVGGGLAEIKMYNVATGGVPEASTTYFPWDTPTSWIGYPTNPWAITAAVAPVAGEAAARFSTPAGTSKTGKPIKVGLYWHSFVGQTDASGIPTFPAGVVTGMSALYNKLQTLSVGGVAQAVQTTPSGGSIGSAGVLAPYVVSHQRTRGRRRKSVMIDGKSYYPATTKTEIVPVEAA